VAVWVRVYGGRRRRWYCDGGAGGNGRGIALIPC